MAMLAVLEKKRRLQLGLLKQIAKSMNGNEKVILARYSIATGLSLKRVQAYLEEFIAAELVERDGDLLRVTEDGKMLLNPPKLQAAYKKAHEEIMKILTPKEKR